MPPRCACESHCRHAASDRPIKLEALLVVLLEHLDHADAGDVLAEIRGNVAEAKLAAARRLSRHQRLDMPGLSADPLDRAGEEKLGVIAQARQDNGLHEIGAGVAAVRL